jgi:hypothetical protein
MQTQPTTAIASAIAATFQHIALGNIAPSKTNPRQTSTPRPWPSSRKA